MVVGLDRLNYGKPRDKSCKEKFVEDAMSIERELKAFHEEQARREFKNITDRIREVIKKRKLYIYIYHKLLSTTTTLLTEKGFQVDSHARLPGYKISWKPSQQPPVQALIPHITVTVKHFQRSKML